MYEALKRVDTILPKYKENWVAQLRLLLQTAQHEYLKPKKNLEMIKLAIPETDSHQ